MTEIDKNGDSKPSLYDVFVSIRNDELVHTSDMKIVGSMSSLYTSHRGSEIVESVLKRGI
jgi:hypothetical protein